MNESVFKKVMAEPTWHESNSLLAQRDMRKRCALVAAETAGEEITRLTARIAELERQLNARVGKVERVAHPSLDAILQPSYGGSDLWA